MPVGSQGTARAIERQRGRSGKRTKTRFYIVHQMESEDFNRLAITSILHRRAVSVYKYTAALSIPLNDGHQVI